MSFLCINNTFIGTNVSLVNTYLVEKHKMSLSTGNQLKAARMLAEMSQEDLAKETGLNPNTIRNLEAAGGNFLSGRADTIRRVAQVLEARGIEFLNGGNPGVRLRKPPEQDR